MQIRRSLLFFQSNLLQFYITRTDPKFFFAHTEYFVLIELSFSHTVKILDTIFLYSSMKFINLWKIKCGLGVQSAIIIWRSHFLIQF